MTAKECITAIPGFRFIFEQLELLSSPGRQAARSMPFMTEGALIAARLCKVERAAGLLHCRAEVVSRLCLTLMQVKDIGGTARRLAAGDLDRQPLDDVELFEVKMFSLLEDDLRTTLHRAEVSDFVALPDLTDVIALLDPEGRRAAAFHIYEAYDPRLAPLRRNLDACTDTTGREAILDEYEQVEAQVRRRLSAELKNMCGKRLTEAIAAVGDLDLLIASVKLADTLSLTSPDIDSSDTCFEGLVNPAVQDALQAEGKQFQPVDILVPCGVTLITGANMAGKSVVLKTVALAQTMAQLGLFVPARRAHILPVETIMLCMGDGQSELSGLSSFSAEMLRIDAILGSLADGVKPLVLIDEPARTTNPDEGRALVNALTEIVNSYGVPALITTHYSGITGALRHLRVRGFKAPDDPAQVTRRNISDYMDYGLYETIGTEVPREAMRIARILGVNTALLEKACEYISRS